MPDNLHAALDADDPIGRDMSISESCASALARSHGASPSSLELPDHPIEEPAAIGEVIVSALFDLAAGDFGTTEDLVSIDGVADSIVDALTAWNEPAAAAALFVYSAAATKEISLTDEDEAGIYTSSGHVVVATEFADVPPIRMAADFVHEAAHHFDAPPHVECFETRTGFPFCDPDSEGAIGFEAAIKYSWLLALAADPAVSGAACRSMCEDMGLWETCGDILDDDGFLPCVDADSACWDHCPV